MMMISKNFTLAELCNSAAAKRFGINNNPDDKVIKNLELLAKNILQPIRDHFDKAIHIVSGYRSPGLNKKVGGASNSQHLIGQAVDIDNDNTDISNAEIFNYIKENIKFDQLIWEFGNDESPDWVHVSYSAKPRKQILRAYKDGSRTFYKKI
jgi:hypothetical protein